MKTLLLALIATGSFAFAQKAERYEIDPAHTAIIFKVNHLGFSHTYGRFNDIEGFFMVDDKNPKSNSVELKIKANSIDTNNKKRDEHLNSPDFFNTKQYPNITFKSKSIKKTGDMKYEVTGDFEMHGKKKTLTIPVEQTRVGQDPWGNTRTGMNANLSLKRSDFGMAYMQGENQVGDQIDIMISLEGIKK